MKQVVEIRPSVRTDLTDLVHDRKLWQKILAYDLSIVTKTFKERNKKYSNIACELELECKRFLYLAAIAPNLSIAPTKPIDEYWHQFIMFTTEYQNFCAVTSGYFVHHNPLGGPDHQTIFTRTQDMVTKLFKKFANIDLWFQPIPATSCKTNCAVPMVPQLR